MRDSLDRSESSGSPAIRRDSTVAIDPFLVCLPASHPMDTSFTGFHPSIRSLVSFTSTIRMSILWIRLFLPATLVGLSLVGDRASRSREERAWQRIHTRERGGVAHVGIRGERLHPGWLHPTWQRTPPAAPGICYDRWEHEDHRSSQSSDGPQRNGVCVDLPEPSMLEKKIVGWSGREPAGQWRKSRHIPSRLGHMSDLPLRYKASRAHSGALFSVRRTEAR